MQNISTSGQTTIGHKFSILGYKSSIWLKQHLPSPATRSPLSLPYICHRVNPKSRSRACLNNNSREKKKKKKKKGAAFLARSALWSDSLHGCINTCRGKEGPGGGIFGQLKCTPSFGLRIWFYLSHSDAPSIYGIASPSPYLRIIFSFDRISFKPHKQQH